MTVQDARVKKNVVQEPSEATAQPTETASEAITETITKAPTAELTEAPTEETTAEPTEAPTEETTAESTEAPTEETTAEPTEAPTEETTAEPTEAPTEETTAEPTAAATEETTAEPTEAPTEETTAEVTTEPTEAPTEEKTAEVTTEPTEAPTEEATEETTTVPAEEPTTEPEIFPTEEEPTEPTEPVYEPIKREKYSGDLYVDKNTAANIGYKTFDYVEIVDVYSDCFFAVDEYNKYIKVNGELSYEWCLGDFVAVICQNVYFDNDRGLYEGDLEEVTYSEIAPPVCYKPVIYLYPEKELNASVKLMLNGVFTCTYPEYNDGWNVTARPDGTLTDEKGMEYNYLFWEAKLKADYDFSKGFCVKGSDTAPFLEQSLKKLGLNRREANEFITFWLQKMQNNPYNIISFQQEAYTDAAKLNINPNPDTLIRVFMAWYPVDEYTELPAQELTAPERNGFTVVEWGGTQVRK